MARGTLTAHLAGRALPSLPAVPGAALQRGAFVTITERGALRGCIGHIAADRALGAVVQAMTIAAARDDPRFPPVAPDELPAVALEISVLSEPAPLAAPIEPTRVVVGRDGLLVRRGRQVGLLLPQVARAYHWGPEAFLTATCRKAGLPAHGWREPGTQVFTFQADVFAEPWAETPQEEAG